MPEERTRASEEVLDLDDFLGPEPLHPDLVDYLRDGPVGRMIHHPLHINVLPMPGHHKPDNRIYLNRKAETETAWTDRDWRRYVFAHERPYRADALMRVVTDRGMSVSTQAFWQLIKATWIDSENVQDHDAFWTTIWRRADIALTLDLKERAAFDALPDPIPVWHGLERQDQTTLGFSWTTDLGIAEWFAHRFASPNSREAFLATGLIQKDNVKAYMLGRGECEIIAFPDDVQLVTTKKCRSKGTPPLAKAALG